jgi:hypothetical protein
MGVILSEQIHGCTQLCDSSPFASAQYFMISFVIVESVEQQSPGDKIQT